MSSSEVSIQLLEDKFDIGYSPVVGERSKYPEINDSQFGTMRFFSRVIYEQFTPLEDENGHEIAPGEAVKYMYLADLQPAVTELPEFARAGLMAQALGNLAGILAEDYDAATDLNFMREYFELGNETFRMLLKYTIDKNKKLGDGKYMDWGILFWTTRVFPDILSIDQLHELVQEPRALAGIGHMISNHMYYGESAYVDRVIDMLTVPKSVVQRTAWETFVQNKLHWVIAGLTAETAIEEVISDKYLRYFPDRLDLANEIEKTIQEFEMLIRSDQQVEGRIKYEQALAAMKAIKAKCEQVVT